MNMFEEATALSGMLKMRGTTQESLPKSIGTTQSYISNKLRLLKLTSAERRLICEGSLTERHARAFLKITDPELRTELIKTAIKRELNVSATEQLIDSRICTDGENAPKERKKAAIKDIRIFYNTLNRAIDVIEKAGLDVAKEKRENDDSIEVVIRISKGSTCA